MAVIAEFNLKVSEILNGKIVESAEHQFECDAYNELYGTAYPAVTYANFSTEKFERSIGMYEPLESKKKYTIDDLKKMSPDKNVYLYVDLECMQSKFCYITDSANGPYSCDKTYEEYRDSRVHIEFPEDVAMGIAIAPIEVLLQQDYVIG